MGTVFWKYYVHKPQDFGNHFVLKMWGRVESHKLKIDLVGPTQLALTIALEKQTENNKVESK